MLRMFIILIFLISDTSFSQVSRKELDRITKNDLENGKIKYSAANDIYRMNMDAEKYLNLVKSKIIQQNLVPYNVVYEQFFFLKLFSSFNALDILDITNGIIERVGKKFLQQQNISQEEYKRQYLKAREQIIANIVFWEELNNNLKNFNLHISSITVRYASNPEADFSDVKRIEMSKGMKKTLAKMFENKGVRYDTLHASVQYENFWAIYKDDNLAYTIKYGNDDSNYYLKVSRVKPSRFYYGFLVLNIFKVFINKEQYNNLVEINNLIPKISLDYTTKKEKSTIRSKNSSVKNGGN